MGEFSLRLKLLAGAGIVAAPFTPYLVDRYSSSYDAPDESHLVAGSLIALLEVAGLLLRRNRLQKEESLRRDLEKTLESERKIRLLAENQGETLRHFVDYITEESSDLFISAQELVGMLGHCVDLLTPYSSVGGMIDLGDEFAKYLNEIGYCGFGDKERIDLGNVLRLHDIGKVYCLDLVNRLGGLSAEEYERVKAHTIRGGDFLASLRSLRHIAPSVRGHHERWDGKGYPDKLMGEDIPLYARIVGVLDAYQAMRSLRPYDKPDSGKPFDHGRAAEELAKCAGEQFDPTLVGHFIRFAQDYEPLHLERNRDLFYYHDEQLSTKEEKTEEVPAQ